MIWNRKLRLSFKNQKYKCFGSKQIILCTEILCRMEKVINFFFLILENIQITLFFFYCNALTRTCSCSTFRFFYFDYSHSMLLFVHVFYRFEELVAGDYFVRWYHELCRMYNVPKLNFPFYYTFDWKTFSFHLPKFHNNTN